MSDYMVAYYTWMAKIEGLTPKRTKVGDLKLKNRTISTVSTRNSLP